MPEKKIASVDSSQSLCRGIRLMEFLSDFPNGCPLAKIAEGTSLNKSTAYRLLKGLQAMGYVSAAPSPGSYRLTSKFVSLGYKAFASLSVIHIASPFLEKLNLDTGDTVNLSTREEHHGVMVYKLEPTTGMLRTRAYVGQRVSLYCSGMGKVFLAYSPEGYLEKYWREMRKEIIRRSANTIVDLKAMRREVAAIRAEKISFDREENERGTSCIAAPIFGLHNRVDYALSISLPTARLDDRRRRELTGKIQATARAISVETGGEF